MTQIADAKKKLAGDLAQDSGGQAIVNQLFDFYIDAVKAAADGMASTTTAATKFWTNPFDFNCYVVSGVISPDATLTANDTNFATITVEVDDAANGTPAAALTWTTTTTGTGNWAVDTNEVHNTRTAANCTIVPNAAVHYQIAKAASGVVVPASRISVRVRKGEY